MIPDFKNKRFTELNKTEKVAFAERVCMDLCDYLKNVSPNTAGLNFARYWRDNITGAQPSMSQYLEFYIYVEGEGLCVTDGDTIASVKTIPREVMNFIQNVVSSIPFRSPIADALARGTKLEEIKNRGIIDEGYSSPMATMKGTKGLKKGKPIDPNSKAQRIKRGELTRYSAYQKKEDDAL